MAVFEQGVNVTTAITWRTLIQLTRVTSYYEVIVGQIQETAERTQGLQFSSLHFQGDGKTSKIILHSQDPRKLVIPSEDGALIRQGKRDTISVIHPSSSFWFHCCLREIKAIPRATFSLELSSLWKAR